MDKLHGDFLLSLEGDNKEKTFLTVKELSKTLQYLVSGGSADIKIGDVCVFAKGGGFLPHVYEASSTFAGGNGSVLSGINTATGKKITLPAGAIAGTMFLEKTVKEGSFGERVATGLAGNQIFDSSTGLLKINLKVTRLESKSGFTAAKWLEVDGKKSPACDRGGYIITNPKKFSSYLFEELI